MASPNKSRTYENIEARDNARMQNDYNTIDASRSYFASLPADEREDLLLSSARSGQVRRLTLLLQAGTNPDCEENWNGFAPLLYAAAGGHEACVNALLDYGADINAGDGYKSALTCAAGKEQFHIVKLLLAEGISTKLALHDAVLNRNPTALRVLLNAGLDVNVPTLLTFPHTGVESSLTLCVRSGGSLEMVKILLEADADVDIQDLSGDTVLMHACGPAAAKGLVPILLEHNANVDIQNGDDWTALMTACWNKEYVHAIALIRAGAAVHFESKDGRTALTMLHEDNGIAVGPDHESVHEALIAAGADPDQVKGRELHLL